VVSVAQGPKPVFPVKVGPTGRYLVDQGGQPVLIQGDAAWSILAATTREGAERYLDDVVAKGFNAIIVSLLEAYFAPDPPRNVYGDEPFVSPGDFATPNEAYMSHADWVIGQAERRGLLVFFVPTYLGHPNPGTYARQYGYQYGRTEGWFADVLANGVEKCRDFGRYLGRRYSGFSNIIWTMGGDRNPDEALPNVRAMAAGIQEMDSRHLFSAHVLPEASPFEEYPDDPWLSIDFTYSYNIVHAALLRRYLRPAVHPNIMIESTYEYDHNASDVQIRRQAYWSILCGASGQFMGTLGMFNFAPGWEDMLDSPARSAQKHLHEFFAGQPWWELVPDLSRSYEFGGRQESSLREFITDGVGELRGLDFASAARTPDGRLAMIYLPTARTITVELSQIAGGAATATWFDPITGSETPGGDHPTSGTGVFTPPSAQDWVLLLQARA